MIVVMGHPEGWLTQLSSKPCSLAVCTVPFAWFPGGMTLGTSASEVEGLKAWGEAYCGGVQELGW